MLLLLVMAWTSLELVTTVEGERCGSNNLGFRCQDDGVCWDEEFVCDGYDQCGDRSDEGKEEDQGCNLYPDSGCASNRGKLHYKCSKTSECFSSKEDAEKCERGVEVSGAGCEEGEFKCLGGRCIPMHQVCDGIPHCKESNDTDGSSDEWVEAKPSSPSFRPGCNFFNDTSAQPPCQSMHGYHYSRCAGLSPEEPTICTNVSVDADAGEEGCRNCTKEDGVEMWRCNNGECIALDKKRDGRPDCKDRSDEVTLDVTWWHILLSTITVVLLGMFISIFCRSLASKNCKGCFHCNLCSSDNKCKANAKFYTQLSTPGQVGEESSGDQVDGSGDCGDDMLKELYPDDDIPDDLIGFLDDKTLNWDQRERKEKEAYLFGRYSPISIKPTVLKEVENLYAQVHLDPIRYHHLYMYLAHRSATVEELAKVTKQLFQWELQMHGNTKLEVVKCWRLHLGASNLTGMVINSVADEKTLASRCEAKCYPVRNMFRRGRRWVFSKIFGGIEDRKDHMLYKVFTLLWESLVPFVEASFFYFEQIKNIVYLYIFHTALEDMTKAKGGPTDPAHSFELFMVVFMILGILLTHLLFLWYSFVYAEDIFEVGHRRKKCKGNTSNVTVKYIFFKFIAMFLSPLMPVYVLANHIWYESKLRMKRRHLQTVEDDLSEGKFDANSDHDKRHEEEERKKKIRGRIDLYKQVLFLETKSLKYRKFYSYFRVTSAVLESVTQVVVLILLLFVCGRAGRSINLDVGVEHHLYSFFDISSDNSGVLSGLNLMRDVVMSASVLWSMFVIISALVKYWYQAKNLAVTLQGQVCLGLYFLALSVNRLTTIISLFANTQPLDGDFDDGSPGSEPKIGITGAFAIFMGLVVILRPLCVLIYKWNFSRNFSISWEKFKWSEVVDRFINLLVNCLVVTPFMVQTENIMVLKDLNEQFMGADSDSKEKLERRRNSLKRKTSVMRMSSLVEQPNRQEAAVLQDYNGVFMPNMNFFTSAFLYNDFRDLIRDLWWEDPSRHLDLDRIMKAVREKRVQQSSLKTILETLDQDQLKENIRITLNHLEQVGMVNQPMLNPVQTKREYFWLFLIVIVENAIALLVEVVNGGVMTREGHYYSWDVRLISLLVAWVFLIAYYKKYHMTRDITTKPVCGTWLHYIPVWFCCKSDTGISAPLNEDATERMISKGDERDSGLSGYRRYFFYLSSKPL